MGHPVYPVHLLKFWYWLKNEPGIGIVVGNKSPLSEDLVHMHEDGRLHRKTQSKRDANLLFKKKEPPGKVTAELFFCATT
jgi:hypothetical protein